MGKPPTTDQELTQRVAALEQRADATDAALEAMDADIENLEFRIIALEDGATTPPVTPPGGEIDNTLPEPEPPTQPIVPPEPPVVGGLSATYVVPSGPRAGSYVYSEAGGDGQAVTVLDDYHRPRWRVHDDLHRRGARRRAAAGDLPPSAWLVVRHLRVLRRPRDDQPAHDAGLGRRRTR